MIAEPFSAIHLSFRVPYNEAMAMSDSELIPAGELVHVRIEERAYQIWEDEGCPTGCELDHWLGAEPEITAAEGVPGLEVAGGAGSKKKF